MNPDNVSNILQAQNKVALLVHLAYIGSKRSRCQRVVNLTGTLNCNRVKMIPSRPVLGKVIHKAPLLKNRAAFEEVAKLYGTLQRGTERRRVTAFRLPGGGASPQSGSFQHLKVNSHG